MIDAASNQTLSGWKSISWLTLVTMLVLEGGTALLYLLTVQRFPSHGSLMKCLGLTLITIFVVEQTPALPCHVALSRMPSQFRRVLYIQPARRFEREWSTFGGGFPSPSTLG